MINVIDEVLSGEPIYYIRETTDGLGNKAYKIELATSVTTAGTPLNKALFDSIKDDLNSRLLISSKASKAEAEAGTNDTKYMTPLKSKQQIENGYLPSKQMSIKTGQTTGGQTIPQTNGYAHYLYIVTPRNAYNNLDENTGHASNYAGFRVVCNVNQTTRVVTAYTESFWYANSLSKDWTNRQNIEVDYYEIAWN